MEKKGWKIILELQPPFPVIIRDVRTTRIELNYWLEKEDAIWLQKSV